MKAMSKVSKLWLGTVTVLVVTALLIAVSPSVIDINGIGIVYLMAVLTLPPLGAAMFLTAIALTVTRLIKPDARILTSNRRIAQVIAILVVLLLASSACLFPVFL